jgi:hypothetical protein
MLTTQLPEDQTQSTMTTSQVNEAIDHHSRTNIEIEGTNSLKESSRLCLLSHLDCLSALFIVVLLLMLGAVVRTFLPLFATVLIVFSYLVTFSASSVVVEFQDINTSTHFPMRSPHSSHNHVASNILLPLLQLSPSLVCIML